MYFEEGRIAHWCHGVGALWSVEAESCALSASDQ